MTVQGQIVTCFDIILNGIWVEGRKTYDWYELTLREVPCEDCGDEPKKVMAYHILIDNQDVYVPESMCVNADNLPEDFDDRTPYDSFIAKRMDTTADVLKEYEEAFGITAEMIYTPDGYYEVVKHVKKSKMEEENEEEGDLSGAPFIY